MARINKEEYQLLKELENRDFKWLAKDRDKTLIASQSRPSKTDEMWRDERTRLCFNYKDSQLFQFIQWEDDSPYNIQELIDEYEEYLRTPVAPKFSIDGVEHLFENESEEKEMTKDIEWLKNEVLNQNLINKDGYIYAGDLTRLLKQLDEPKVLSSDWIGENVEYAYFDMLDGSGRLSSATAIIKPEKLQNLLVPKQEDMFNGEKPDEGEVYFAIGFGGAVEINSASSIGEAIERLTEHETNYAVSKKPVIPKFVADWIEEVKPDNSLRVAFEYIAQQKRDNYDDELAFWVEEGNSETFARGLARRLYGGRRAEVYSE